MISFLSRMELIRHQQIYIHRGLDKLLGTTKIKLHEECHVNASS
jgi:hypothetical protein